MKTKNPFADNGCRCLAQHAITREQRTIAWLNLSLAARNEDLTDVLVHAAMLMPCKTSKLPMDEDEIMGHLSGGDFLMKSETPMPLMQGKVTFHSKDL